MATTFLKDQGSKLTHDGRSVLIQGTGLLKEGNYLTDREIKSMASILGRYVDGVSNRAELPFKRIDITRASSPALPDSAGAYKFTTDDALPYWLDGNIRLNPLAFYQEIENEKARDVREGLAFTYLRSTNRSAFMGLMAGFNAFAICASADARKTERMERHRRFGARLIRINRANEFARKVADLIGARRYVVRDVTYSDAKAVKAQSDLPDILVKLNGTGDLQSATLEYLAEHHIDELIQIAEAASAFTKPNTYWVERERRFLFIMDKDVTTWTSAHDPTLAEHIELIV